MPIAVAIAFLVVLFREALFGGPLLLVGDPLRQFYPIRTVAWQMIRDGDFPFWAPHILSGYPLASMAMLGLGYPLTWGYLFLPGEWAEQIYVLAPYLLAPIFTYLFLRECGRSPEASLLGGLTFGYGGFLFSPIGLTGVHANSALWLPLYLLGIAHARRRPLLPSLLLGTAAYTMSVLAGSGQMFLYAGGLGIAYGSFLAAFPDRIDGVRPRRWQPLAVAFGGIALAAGLAAFQMLETWTAVSQSVREAYPAARVEEGSFRPELAWHSLIQPLGNYRDSSTYVPLLALVLAAVALFGHRKPQIWFWSGVAVISWLLVLGEHSPIFDLYTQLPFVKLFRFPSRHTFEWSFAIGVLGAHGWDVVESRFGGRETDRRPRAALVVAAAAVLIAVASFVAVQWRAQTVESGIDRISDMSHSVLGLRPSYIGWKLAFTASATIAVAVLWRLRQGRLRLTLVSLAIGFACFVEPHLWMVRPFIGSFSAPRELFGSFAETTHLLRSRISGAERTFSLPHPYAISTDAVRDVDAVNWTALAGLEDANGYESLILSRYSRAFRGVADAEPFVIAEERLLWPNARVFDLLNVRYVVAYSPFAPVPGAAIEKDGIVFTTTEFAHDVKSDRPFILIGGGAEADSIAVVTTLGMAGFVEQGEAVARMTVHTTDGRVIARDLIAGIHTSELGHDAPHVKPGVRHQRAPVFDSRWSADGSHFEFLRYVAKIDFGERVRVARVDFLKTAKTPEAGVGLWKASLHDTSKKKSTPLPQPDPEQWRTIHDRNGVVVLENLRALPRAWIVKDVGILDEEELLRLIRGENELPFDPRTTAFLEPSPASSRAVEQFAAKARPATSPAAAAVRIVERDPARLVFETTSDRDALLVVSEIHYPGWTATVDGIETPIHRTNFLLRGVFVPPGKHTVVMTYRAPGARRGAMVSLATLVAIGLASRSHRLRQL